jgi:hypothetical protein
MRQAIIEGSVAIRHESLAAWARLGAGGLPAALDA